MLFKHSYLFVCVSLIACGDSLQSEVEADIVYRAFEDICLPIMQAASEVKSVEKLYGFDVVSKSDSSLSRSYPRSSRDYLSHLKRPKVPAYYYPLKHGAGYVRSGASFYKKADELPSALSFTAGPRMVTSQDEPVYEEIYEGYGCSLTSTFTNLESVNAFKTKLGKIKRGLILIERRDWNLRLYYMSALVKDYKFCSEGDANDSSLSIRFSHHQTNADNIHSEQRFKVGISDEPCDIAAK